ncbi:class I SAM-dependent methyltransferase [Cryptosporangium phraense]|uniref:Class I SAM-dependent methyltransferase n=1 Tax=Cryptosporangium phraense TaxID=2593070 RepID=A0A545AKS7_9ACTN|nr:class I SAM-dependent methyltransferase [Cryptosporangium phraense]TQS41345.1 class I SAM-dependent methyltransferase [Cryptosporangium phraense]
MPTQPSHEARQIAESFGADADRYDRARPRYPDALIARIARTAPGPDVLDVGTGTGIAARQLREAGCIVHGVEVDARMAALARRYGIETDVAGFETWDSAGRTFDAVVAAQTWHWIDPSAGAAKAASVLRPGGLLALFWNVWDPDPDLAEAFGAVYREVLPDLPFKPWARPSGRDPWRLFFEPAEAGLRGSGAFGPVDHWFYEWQRTYTRDEWLDQVPTSGGHTTLPQPQLDALLAGIGAAVDAVGGSFVLRYTAVALVSDRQ